MGSIDIVLDLIPDDANRRSGGSSVRRRCELIALALVIGTVGVILQFGLQGFALGRNDISTGQFNWSAFLSTLTAAGVVDQVSCSPSHWDWWSWPRASATAAWASTC